MLQIEYVFSDKTGTLTENQMVFKKAYFGDRAYGKHSSKLPDGIQVNVHSNPNTTKLPLMETHSQPSFDFRDAALYTHARKYSAN